NAISLLRETNADAVFSGTTQRGFVWGIDTDGTPQSLTYDWRQRKRGQDMDPRFVENGSIYVFRPDLLRKTSNRLGGSIRIYEMDYWSSFEIDTPEDMELLEWILRRPDYAAPIAWPTQIDLVVFDFDGVMTDNAAFVDEHGIETVRINRADGLGLDKMHALEMPMLILSTECNPVVAERARKLRIDAEHGIADKAKRLAEIIAERSLDPARVIYVGNDLNDLGCFELVGLPIAVADAHSKVRSAARHVLSRNGGNGAVRELCELIENHMQQQKAEKS
ncbi:MAG: HAD hydrolase family protein, partial [Alphaproteobacteria bacterium]